MTGADNTVVTLLVLVGLALIPFALLTVTAFVKISVVLSILRSALGSPEIPPTPVLTGLALVLSAYVMSPVATAVYRDARPALERGGGGDLLSARTVGALAQAADRGKEPVRAFLVKHAGAKDRTMFYELALRMRTPAERPAVKDSDLLVLVPAFVVSELKRAFQIGFLLFIPFLVIDIVVASILSALGMHMLAPSSVALPFKLLLFVLVGGWQLIARGLIQGYV
ncbi:MAG TPA: type III secretion system export apparatus subunit SctR [Polyangia bacterium]|nr:type III secretion system export apparatus subunit SctR [Polyangia bacterium]